jgi:hypothetical protein
VSERERLRREDPGRSGPIRNFSNLYRRSDSWDREDSAAEGNPDGATGSGSYSDVVAYGVELGYQVIQEQIHQGQRIAEQLSKGSYDANAMAGDFRELAERAWRYYADLGGLWLDYVFALIGGNGELARKLLEMWQVPQASTTKATDGAVGISVEVACARPTRATLDLRSHCERMTLVCQPLRALDADKPALTDVAFERAADGVLSLHVRVAETQPPGTYVGAVIDSETSQARGTLSVTVS